MDTTPQTGGEKAFWCGYYAAGIILTLLVYGLLQQRIMQLPYGDPPQFFTDSVFLIMWNRIFAFTYALIMAIAKGEALGPQAPIMNYFCISLSNVYASTCQYEALKYVSFPVQMLGKSFKMMPVMLWSKVIKGKSNSWQEWGIAFAVTGGVTEFLLTGPVGSSTSTENSAYGFLLLLLFLALDGFTSTMQSYLFEKHATTKFNQMMYVNLCSIVISSLSLFATGGVGRSLAFCIENPAFILDALILGLSAATSQWFIYAMIQGYGAVVFAASMNVRQITSIFFSYFTYGVTLTGGQVIGLLCVFGALGYKSYDGLINPKSDEAEKTK